MITPTIINNLQWKAYLIFMCLNFSFIPLVYFCYPETANLTLEEIDWLFYEGKAVQRSKRVAKHGWGPGEGVARTRQSPAVLESGSVESKEQEKENVERVENSVV